MGHNKGNGREGNKREERGRKVEHWIEADKGRVIVVTVTINCTNCYMVQLVELYQESKDPLFLWLFGLFFTLPLMLGIQLVELVWELMHILPNSRLLSKLHFACI